jgi:hypothetical protein
MSESELARRYLWWLALYPWAYRREHEEEMLAVLLEGARPGQEFPRVVEILDLIWGALRMRLQLGQRYPGNIGSDALAVFSLLAPLILAGPVLVTLALHLVHGPSAPDPHFQEHFPGYSRMLFARIAAAHGVNLGAEGQLAVAIAVVLRLRRVALALIAVVLAVWIFDPRYGFTPEDVFGGFFLACYVLEATALIASPGPRRGLQLMSWKSGAVLAGAAAVLTVTWTLTMRLAYGDGYTSSGNAEVNGLAVLALIVLAAGVFLFSQLGRYVVVLFAAVFFSYVFFLGRVEGAVSVTTQGEAFAVQYGPPVVAVCAVVAVALRRKPRRVDGGPRNVRGTV